MTISYYEASDAKRPLSRGLRMLMGANAVVALASLSAWTLVSLLVAEPIGWATWVPINRGDSLDDVFEYPFLLLWLMPLAGAAAGWCAAKVQQNKLANLCMWLPLSLLGAIFGWYYLAPAAWH